MALLSASRPTQRSRATESLPTTRDSSPRPSNHPTEPPSLLNELGAGDTESILCLLIRDERVYAGSQGGDIHVWDLKTLARKGVLSGHTGAILALQFVPECDWLISSSGDGTIRTWNLPTFSELYLIHPPHDNVGDIFSLAWVGNEVLSSTNGPENVKRKGRLFAGCQDTSIQWIDLPPPHYSSTSPSMIPPSSNPLDHLLNMNSPPRSSPPIYKPHNKFFDSLSINDRPIKSRERSSASSVTGEWDEGYVGKLPTEEVIELQIGERNLVGWAHYGYVYCLITGRSNEQDVLISGSGDEQIKIWKPTSAALTLLRTLESTSDAVLTLAIKESTLFAGHQGGVIKIWDLDTLKCIRNLRPHQEDILTISLIDYDFFCGSADGKVFKFDKRFNLVTSWQAHEDIVLSSGGGSGNHLLTGGNDAMIKIWDFPDDDQPLPQESVQDFQGKMFHTLAKLVSFKTIADEEHREECRQGALYLKRILHQLGASTTLLSGATNKNPLVVATFQANAPHFSTTPTRRKKRVLFYGHYDVIPAAAETWKSDPFKMSGKNGWVYGRGVSDNKGPILAIAIAAAELREKGELEVDLVMIIEGEEETGSSGFQDAVKSNLSVIGDIDVILVSNSYWIGEEIPCLTFGLRGVIHASININSDQPDLHSGMQGGDVSEPLLDMVRLLASLTDTEGKVKIPSFLEDVRVLGQVESAQFDTVVHRSNGEKGKLKTPSQISDPKASLITRWRQPALSIHNVKVIGPSKTLIPSSAKSNVSIRIVPDQSLDKIVLQLEQHLHKCFASLRTFNKLSIGINHTAEWWLGDIENAYFKAFAQCIQSEWGIEPLLIREGGSIPSLPFLERQFNAKAIQFPMGTSSDSAHLPDERIRIVNLEKGKNIVREWFGVLANIG